MIDKSELIATLMAVQSGEMDIKKAADILTAKRRRGRPKTGLTATRKEMWCLITCAYVVIRPHVKNNDEAYWLISDAFSKSESEVKRAAQYFTRYDHDPQVWFRFFDGQPEMILVDIATRNRIFWDWHQGRALPEQGFCRLKTVSTAQASRKFLTAVRDLDT